MPFLPSEAKILDKCSNSYSLIFSQYFKFLSHILLFSSLLCLFLLVTFLFISCLCLPEFLEVVSRQLLCLLSHYATPSPVSSTIISTKTKLRNVPEVPHWWNQGPLSDLMFYSCHIGNGWRALFKCHPSLAPAIVAFPYHLIFPISFIGSLSWE